MSKSQCIDCMHRYPACHSGCELYKAYHRDKDVRSEKIKTEKAKELQANQVREAGVSRSRRR